MRTAPKPPGQIQITASLTFFQTGNSKQWKRQAQHRRDYPIHNAIIESQPSIPAQLRGRNINPSINNIIKSTNINNIMTNTDIKLIFNVNRKSKSLLVEVCHQHRHYHQHEGSSSTWGLSSIQNFILKVTQRHIKKHLSTSTQMKTTLVWFYQQTSKARRMLHVVQTHKWKPQGEWGRTG